MKIGIYNPYFGTPLGGGERYILTIAEYLSQKGHWVDLFWHNDNLKKKAFDKLKLNLKAVNQVKNIFLSKTNIINRYFLTKKYDQFIWLSDGSIPFLFAKKNIIHFQVPFINVGGSLPLTQIKIRRFNKIICNSFFTKKFIDQEFRVKSKVVYPPVEVEEFKPIRKKENLILSAGRFTRALHSKKQEVLIEVFKKMVDSGLVGWQLILAGNVLPREKNYLNNLRDSAGGYPIKIFTDLDFNKLKEYYQKAKIFWHATGFGEDEEKHPEKMEHFGIVVVEAMAAGCVPVVIGRGGIPEIVNHGKDGFLWQSKKELEKLTLQLIKSPERMKRMAGVAQKSSRRFSEKVFCKKISKFVTAQ